MTSDPDLTFGRPFVLARDADPTGTSGTGIVADGVLWPDNTVSIRWRGQRPSTVFWDSLADAMAVHGHEGSTRLVWEPHIPQAGWGGAWMELRSYVDQAREDGKPVRAEALADFMDELKRKALAPVRDWMDRIRGETP